MLTVKNISCHRGKTPVLQNISLFAKENTVTALIGANGAGKTTLLSLLAGLLPADSGEIMINGISINALSQESRVRRGLCLVPEGRRVFKELTVKENLLLGGYLLASSKARRRCEALLTQFPRLKERQNTLADKLSGGEQQLLAIARALMLSPRLLLLDEPTMGLSPEKTDEIAALIKCLCASTTILLVEQNAALALSLSQYAYCLENGSITLSGKSSHLAKDPRIKRAYLGG